MSCSHSSVCVDPSSNVEAIGYKPYTAQQLFTAATGSRKHITLEHDALLNRQIFPAPLALPGDELANDPKYPPQSFKLWLGEEARNVVTEARQTVYIAVPPRTSLKSLAASWTKPRPEVLENTTLTSAPLFSHVLQYLQAFFHGLPVRQLPINLELTNWDKGNTLRFGPDGLAAIGLASSPLNTVTRVRVRKLASQAASSAYSHQLNLDDLLDHAISILPSDAYCLIMLVEHDLYEVQEDDFCCGRAYGGSRVAVVSTAQHQPALDDWHGLARDDHHWWPGSHCTEFVNSHCATSAVQESRGKISKKSKTKTATSANRMETSPMQLLSTDTTLPMEAAFSRHVSNLSRSVLSQKDLQSLYLRRIVLTLSHEALHCFGFDHCVHQACAMQGTSSILEDSRQPPFLCFVCEHKLAKAVTSKVHSSTPSNFINDSKQNWWDSEAVVAHRRARHERILGFCEASSSSDPAFSPLAAWIRAYLTITQS